MNKNAGSMIALLLVVLLAYVYRAQLGQLLKPKAGTPTLGFAPGSSTLGWAAGTNPSGSTGTGVTPFTGSAAGAVAAGGFQPSTPEVTTDTNPNSPSGGLGITGYD